MASGFPSTDYSVPCLALFFDAMSGVKKLTKVHAISDYYILAYHPSTAANTNHPSNPCKPGIIEAISKAFCCSAF